MTVLLGRRGCAPGGSGGPGPGRWTSHVLGVGQLEVGEARPSTPRRRPQLHAGQVRAEAPVDAEPERGVAVPGPIDDELVGSIEHLGVAVGCRERQQHPVVGADRAAAELDVLGDHAGHGHRGVEAQELLDGEGAHVGVLDQAPAVVGVLGQVPQAGADGRPGGVDAGDDQQGDGAADVVGSRAVAVELGVEQVADEVVSGVAAVLLDDPGEVVVERVLVGRWARCLPGASMMRWMKPRNRSPSSSGSPEHLGDDPHRDVLGVGVGGVTTPPSATSRLESSSNSRHDAGGAGSQRLDRLRRERREQQAAGVGMERWVGGDRRGVARRGGAVGRQSVAMTPWLVKCSVSWAMASTSPWRVGSQTPPKRSVWATGQRPRSSSQISVACRGVVGVGVVEVGGPVLDRCPGRGGVSGVGHGVLRGPLR